MKYKLPHFLENIKSPQEGEFALRKYANEYYPLDLFDSSKSENCKNTIIVGIDEVGRGPLAGPVVACASVLKSPDIMSELNDSKKLTRSKRELLYEKVKDSCICYAIASASVEEIDKLNILEADFLAMRRALQALQMPKINESLPDIPIEKKGSFFDVFGEKKSRILIAVDGNLKIRGINPEKQIAIIKGDARVASISASSILAKVFRDRIMDKLAKEYPHYGFEVNAGYGTKSHLEGIRKFGFTPIHRKSFHPKSIEL